MKVSELLYIKVEVSAGDVDEESEEEAKIKVGNAIKEMFRQHPFLSCDDIDFDDVEYDYADEEDEDGSA